MAAGVLILGGVSFAAAPSASAAELGAFNGCVPGNIRTTIGDSFLIGYPTACGGPGVLSLSSGYRALYVGDDCFYVAHDGTQSGVSSQVAPVVITFDEALPTAAELASVCGFVVPPAEAPTADALPIPEWVQAYARASADATCLDGWDASWAEWPNGGKGGFVCQRSIPSLG